MENLIKELNELAEQYGELTKGSKEKAVNESRQMEIHATLQKNEVNYGFSVTKGYYAK